jgi:hypothetical protein
MNDTLLTTAMASFRAMTEAEEELLSAAVAGRQADCSFGKSINPTQSAKWGKRRIVRAELSRWLLSDGSAVKLINPYGLSVRGARIVGRVDLDSMKIAFPVALRFCAVAGGIVLRDAEIRRLDLGGSRVRFIEASGLEVRGDLILSHGFRASQGVSLPTVQINGNFDCTGSTFLGPFNTDGDVRDYALNADGAKVGGDLFLRDRFEAKGCVSLFGADIKLNGDCGRARFANKAGIALYFSKTKIGANLLMRDLHAIGEVRLHGAQVTGNLECQAGRFCNRGGLALLADGLKVGGRAFLSDVIADGEVSLYGASINGEL